MNACRLFLLSSLVIVLFLAPTSSAALTEPATYRNWDGDVDWVIVNRAFRADDYQEIIVEPLDLSKVVVPEGKGENPAAILALLPSLKPAFLKGMQENLRRREPLSGAPQKALVIRVRLTKADPGTRAPAFGDIKANAAKLEVSGDVIDLASGTVFVSFQQERWSGLITIGKNSGQLLQDAAALIGADIGRLISSF